MSIRLQALPELVDLWAALEQLAADEGISIAVADFGGFRTSADTAQILEYKQADYNAYAAEERRAGRTPMPITGPWDWGSPRPIAPYGRSFHDYGAARDFAITRRPAGMTTDDAVARVDAIAEGLGLRSGASWSDPHHLELAIPLADAQARWAAVQEGGPSLGLALAGISIAVGLVAVVRSRGLGEWR